MLMPRQNHLDSTLPTKVKILLSKAKMGLYDLYNKALENLLIRR